MILGCDTIEIGLPWCYERVIIYCCVLWIMARGPGQHWTRLLDQAGRGRGVWVAMLLGRGGLGAPIDAMYYNSSNKTTFWCRFREWGPSEVLLCFAWCSWRGCPS